MSKPTTHVLFVTDRSGSMEPLAADVRGGFNAYVDGLRADKQHRYRLTVTLFDTRSDTLCTAVKLADVPRLNEDNYRPGGMTALLDAVGATLAAFDRRVPALADGDRVLVVVQTDGHENSSIEYSREQIAAQIRAREATGRWSFVFLGAGPDAWAQAAGMGFAAAQTVSTAATSAGTRSTYVALSRATTDFAELGDGVAVAAAVADAAGDGDG